MPETTAARRSALARSRIDDIAISRPSDETATAPTTPAVADVMASSSQLNVRASGESSATRPSPCPLARTSLDGTSSYPYGLVIRFLPWTLRPSGWQETKPMGGQDRVADRLPKRIGVFAFA